jgi:8-oxo-dGTP diphosphatase
MMRGMVIRLPNVYGIGFRDGRFLMVYNPKRKGWEMPGGKLEGMETPLEGMMREYREETGFELEVLDCRPMGEVVVFAGLVGRGEGEGEMRWELMDELPVNLAFPECEYLEQIAWTREVVEHRLGRGRTLK